MHPAFGNRVLAGSGVVFVILWVAGAVVQAAALPDYRASAAEVVRSFQQSHDALHVAAFLKGLGLLGFLVFVGALCARLGQRAPELGWLSTFAMGAGVGSGALLLIPEAVLRAGFHGVAVHGSDPSANADAARALFDVFLHFHAATAFVLAPFLATLAILGLAGHGLPRWLSYASAVLSLAFALGGAAALFWYGAFLGLLLWIVAVCVVAIAGEKLSAKAPETLTLLG